MRNAVMYERRLFEPEHEMFRESYREFLQRHVAPYHSQWEEDKIVDRQVWLEAGKRGFLGTAIPEEYGGGGNPDFRFNVIVTEETTAGRYSGIGFALHNVTEGIGIAAPILKVRVPLWLFAALTLLAGLLVGLGFMYATAAVIKV